MLEYALSRYPITYICFTIDMPGQHPSPPSIRPDGQGTGPAHENGQMIVGGVEAISGAPNRLAGKEWANRLDRPPTRPPLLG